MRGTRVAVSIMVHLAIFLAGLVLTYRVLYSNREDDEIRHQYTSLFKHVRENLDAQGVDLNPLQERLNEGEAIYKRAKDTRSDYNAMLTYIIASICILLIIVAGVLCRNNLRLFVVVLLENLYILALLGIVLGFFYYGMRDYHFITADGMLKRSMFA